MIRNTPLPILLVASLLTAMGCTASNPLARWATAIKLKSEYHEEIAAERALNAEKNREVRYALKAQRERAKLRSYEQCGKVVPEVESTLGLNMRQRFSVGEPELDIAEMDGQMEAVKHDYNQRMQMWEIQMSAWNQRKQAHYEQQKQALEANPYSESGDGGCSQYTDLAPFCEPPPPRPKVSYLASKIPLKLSLRMGTMFDDASVGNMRTRKVLVPTERKPLSCQSCKPNAPCSSCASLEKHPSDIMASAGTFNTLSQQVQSQLQLPQATGGMINTGSSDTSGLATLKIATQPTNKKPSTQEKIVQ